MTTGAGAQGDANGAGDGGQQAAPLDIDALLADPSQHGTAIKVGDLTSYLEAKTGSILETVRNDLREQERAARERQSALDERNANAKVDIDFANDIETRLKSDDEAVRAAALADKNSDPDKYRRGLALSYERDSAATRHAILSEHLAPMWQQLRTEGFEKFIDEDLKNTEFLSKYLTPGGEVNWLKALTDVATARGYERGKNEAADEADRQRRAAEGATGAHGDDGNGGGGPNDDLWAGIDRNQPGAAALYSQRLNARREQQASQRR